MSNIMVSSEIADKIDEKQFVEESDEITDISQQIIVKFEKKKDLIPGILERYMNRVVNGEQELTISFLTATKNAATFLKNIENFNIVKLSYGDESVGEHNVEGLMVVKVEVEQKPAQAGCVITVVYR